ncbi:MAG: hypothetical protein ACHQEM_00820 [Chitinophagales bacterium]
MKKHTNLSNTVLLIAMISLPAMSFAANGDDIDKKKNLSKSYTVTASDKLEIDNSFGNVVINTWEKNEIKVDVEIGVKASTEEKAQDMMNEIEVKDYQSGHSISWKTDIGDINDNHHGKRNKNNDENDRKFYIDYTIHMPAGNPLQIENSFGKITVPDFKGQVNLTSKFGGLTTGKLADVDEIDVEFGSAELGSIHNGEVTFKFNSKSTIDNVSGSVKVKSEFSGDVQFGVDNNIQELSVSESYSTIRMTVTKSLSAKFDIHTSFGNFKNVTDINISEEKEDDDNGPKFDRDYSGQSGDGKAKIKIKSSFGKVRISDSGEKPGTSKNDSDDEDEKSNKVKSKSI